VRIKTCISVAMTTHAIPACSKLLRWSRQHSFRDADGDDDDDDAIQTRERWEGWFTGSRWPTSERRLRSVLSSVSWHRRCAGSVWASALLSYLRTHLPDMSQLDPDGAAFILKFWLYGWPFIMAALRSRRGHYILQLWFLSYSFFFFFFFHRLISAVADWMYTILLHVVRP